MDLFQMHMRNLTTENWAGVVQRTKNVIVTDWATTFIVRIFNFGRSGFFYKY